jgi:hypothetical protein
MQTRVERLPLAAGQGLVDVQARGDSDIWVAADSDLAYFDGRAWTAVSGPTGGAVTSFSVAANDTLFVTAAGRLWKKAPGSAWVAVKTSGTSEALESVVSERGGQLWLTTRSTLLTTHATGMGELCQARCQDYWHEEARLSKVPHGD